MTQPNKLGPAAEGKLRVLVWILTGLVFVLIGLMRRPEFHIDLPPGVSLDFLPAVYSTLNALVAVCLVFARRAVKHGDIARHQRYVTTAMILSGLFLLGYVLYHFTSTETKFMGTGCAASSSPRCATSSLTSTRS